MSENEGPDLLTGSKAKQDFCLNMFEVAVICFARKRTRVYSKRNETLPRHSNVCMTAFV